MQLRNLIVFFYNLYVVVAWRHIWKKLDQTLSVECNGHVYMMGDQVVDIECDSHMSNMTSIERSTTKFEIKRCWDPSKVVDKFDADFATKNCLVYEVDKEGRFVPQERDFDLNLQSVEWPGWTTMENVVEINMKNVTPVGTWDNCSDLKVIRIFQTINLTLASEGWLSNCKNLEYILMNGIPLDQMIAVVKSAPESVNMIDLYDLSYSHELSVCSFEPAIAKKKRVTCADLSVSLIAELARLPKLETLYVESIELDFCAGGSDHPVNFPSLRYLALHKTRTDHVCFKSTRGAPLLTEIVIEGPIGITFQFSELITTPRNTPQLMADFTNVAVAAFQFTREDYLILEEGSRVILQGLARPLDCSCTENLWLVQAMKAGWVEIPGAFCTDGSPPMDMMCDRLPCQRINCNSSCVCCRDGPALIGDCRDAYISSLPTQLLTMENLTEILAPSNNISTLPDYLPDTLEFLDLRDNNVWKAGAAHVEALFANPQRRVRLAGNTIFCTCEYQTLIGTLQSHKNKVEDFEELICDFSDEKISEVVVAELCAAQERDAAIKLAVSIALCLAVVGLVLAVVWHHRQDIRIYLYARGCCHCCIREDELDSDRPYDVFLTYSHEDSELVVNELLPVLDKDYSVCMHERDWCPGQMIPTQIALSVERSRRTVVVLSRNFVRSMWGRLEFQTAHVSGLTEGRVRVIMIVLDDVLERDELSAEMRAYVRLNTYVRWDDPWLWDKLKYALPHRPRGPLSNTVFKQTLIGIEDSKSDKEENKIIHDDKKV